MFFACLPPKQLREMIQFNLDILFQLLDEHSTTLPVACRWRWAWDLRTNAHTDMNARYELSTEYLDDVGES